MAAGTLGISLTGLYAAQAGIRTTEHNIANVNTPGYRRQETVQSAQLPQYMSGSYFGRGVLLDSVRQAYDRFLDNEVLLNQGQQARHEVYSAYAGQVDKLLSDEGAGIASGMDRFFDAVDGLADDPSSVVARQSLLSAGQGLTDRINNLAGKLEEMQRGVDGEIRTLVADINAYARQLVQLNTAITRLESTTGDQANDLRDQRQLLVAEINKLVNVTVLEQGDGSFNLYVGSGQPLVLGAQAYSLVAAQDPYEPTRLVAAIDLGGSQQILDGTLVTGGRLGGLTRLRSEVLQPAIQDLGRVALGIAEQFNAVHDDGYGLLDSTHRLFFGSAGGLINPPMANTGNSTADPPVIGLTLSSANALTSSDYRLVYDGANYQLTRLSDNQLVATIAPGANATVDGFTLSAEALASSSPASGDNWLIRPTATAAGQFGVQITNALHIAAALTLDGGGVKGLPGDNENALALAGLRTARQLGASSETYQTAYTALMGSVAILASEADTSLTTFTKLSQEAEAAQQNVSGVNLDEEAANLIRYQQAYQAAARAIQIAASLFDEILAVVR